MNRIAKIGDPIGGHQITVTETEIVDKFNRGFKKVVNTYPVSGAKAEFTDDNSGWRNQHHQYNVTITLATGHQIIYTRTAKGTVGRVEVSNAQRFAVKLNNAAIEAALKEGW